MITSRAFDPFDPFDAFNPPEPFDMAEDAPADVAYVLRHPVADVMKQNTSERANVICQDIGNS